MADLPPYTLLRPREIRVLSLYPSASFHDDLHCTLRAVSLDEKPEYEALSYVWSTPPGTSKIILHGRPHEIALNLSLALRRLRKANDIRNLWVDALCINQGNLDEKSHQVLLMSEIYSLTTSVLIWLGDSLDGRAEDILNVEARTNLPWEGKEFDTTYTMETAGNYFLLGFSPEEYNQAFRIQDVPSIDEERDLPWDDQKDKLRQPGFAAYWLVYLLSSGRHIHELPCFDLYSRPMEISSKRFQAAFQALSDLFNLPWWKRIWCVQETILPRKATVILGSLHAPWNMFAAASKTLERHDATCCASTIHNLRGEMKILFEKIVNNVQELEYERDRLRTRGSVRASFDLLWQYRCRLATDPRDMIYGVLGIAADLRKGIVPDYRDEVTQSEVYQQATLFMIQETKRLSVLQGTRDENSSMPSWVTDWSTPVEERQWFHERTRLRQSADYQPSKGQDPDARVDGNGSLLISGLDIDTVAEVSDLVGAYESPKSLSRRIQSWLELARLPRNGGSPYIGGGVREHAFWHAITRDRVVGLSGEQQRARPSEYIPIALWWHHESTQEVLMGNNSQEGGSILNRAWRYIRSFLPKSPPPYMSEEALTMFIRVVGTSVAGHTFFITKNGYFGLGKAEIGDQVFVLAGGITPFLLRSDREPDHFRLIGDCYLQGIMYGEAMEKWEEKKRTVVLV